MKKQLSFTGNMCYLYLTKTYLQLLKIQEDELNFLLEIKDDTLYLKKYKEDNNANAQFIKKARKVGNGYGIFFTKSMLELLDINPTTDKVDISINGETLSVKKS